MIEVKAGEIPTLDVAVWRSNTDGETRERVEKVWPKGYGLLGLYAGFAYFQRISLHTPTCPCGRCPSSVVDGPIVGKIAL